MANLDFAGKVALITGGSSGIGRATALEFAKRGAHIAINAVREQPLQDTATEIEQEPGRRCLVLPGDVGNIDVMRACFERLMDVYGRLDVLVNSAGINVRHNTRETSLEEWNEVIRVNLTGTFICCKLAAEIMAKQREGAIINVSSLAAKTGATSPHYTASKAGVLGLTKSLAKELAAYNVRVNSIAPGGVDHTQQSAKWTPQTRGYLIKQTPLHRLCEPQEVATAIAFLASPDASYITGATLHVNGGLWMN